MREHTLTSWWQAAGSRRDERLRRHRHLESQAHRRRDRAGRSHEADALHRAGRRERGRSNGDGGHAAGAGGPGSRRSRSTSRLPRRFRARSRAPARSATTFSSASGFRRSACSIAAGTVELPPVSRRHRVLCRFRRLRRAHDRSARLAARRHRPRARAHGQRRRHDDPPLLSGGRARLRVDDEPGFPRSARAVRACRPAAGRHAAAAAARARVAGGAPFRKRARDAAGTTANGSAHIPTATSRSSIPRGRAQPTAWSTRRSSPSAHRG